jgi:hypothetical protein
MTGFQILIQVRCGGLDGQGNRNEHASREQTQALANGKQLPHDVVLFSRLLAVASGQTPITINLLKVSPFSLDESCQNVFGERKSLYSSQS